MNVKLSDRDLRILSLFIPISEIPQYFEGRSPARRTIYRRLNKYPGWQNPNAKRKLFERKQIQHFPPEWTDAQCRQNIRHIMSDLFNQFLSEINDNLDRQEAFWK